MADALTKLHGDGDLLCRQAITVSVEAPEIVAARRQENENGKGYRESSHIKVAGACGRYVDVCDHNDKRDLT